MRGQQIHTSMPTRPLNSRRLSVQASPILANPFRTGWRAGPFVICSLLAFRCCFRLLSECRLELLRVAAERLVTLFSVLPASCRRFRRSRFSPCLFPCPFLGSACAPRLQHFSSMDYCQSCATPRPGCRTFPEHCANRQSRSDLAQSRGFGKFICPWHLHPSSPASKPAQGLVLELPRPPRWSP